MCCQPIFHQTIPLSLEVQFRLSTNLYLFYFQTCGFAESQTRVAGMPAACAAEVYTGITFMLGNLRKMCARR
jgi:hypothetical protein